MTNSMTTYKTTFESTRNLPAQVTLGHGENADLAAGITDNGVEVDLTGYTARAIYQPFSKIGSDDWYECPCEITGNTAVAHWGHACDNGENTVRLFMHLSKDGKVAYPAIYQLRLFETPGFNPAELHPIPETLDFSKYTLLNAPWPSQADFDDLAGAVDDKVGQQQFEGLANLVTYNTNAIADLSEVVGSKASQSEVEHWAGVVEQQGNQIDTLADAVDTNAGAISDLNSEMAQKASQSALNALSVIVDGKAEQHDVDTLSAQVGTNTGDIHTLQSQMAYKADAHDLQILANTVAQKADQSDLNTLSGVVAQMVAETWTFTLENGTVVTKNVVTKTV